MLSQWGILMALAKFGSPGIVGQFALGLAVSAPVFMLTNFGMRQIVVTNTVGVYSFRTVIGVRVVAAFVGMCVTGSIAMLLSDDSGTGIVVASVGLARGFESVSDMTYGVFQRQERFDLIGRSMIIRSVLSVGAVWTALKAGGSVESAGVAWASSCLVVLLAHDLVIAGRSGLRAHSADVSALGPSSLITRALPLGLAGGLAMLNVNMPRYWLAHFGEAGTLGLFAAAAYLPMAGRHIIEAVAQAAVRRLAALYSVGRLQEFRSLVLRLVVLASAAGGAAVVVAAAVGRVVLSLAYTPEYASNSNVLTYLTMSWALRYPCAIISIALVSAHRFQWIPAILILPVIGGLVAGWVLIPRYGIEGAAWADMVSSLIQLAVTLVVARTFFHRHLSSIESESR